MLNLEKYDPSRDASNEGQEDHTKGYFAGKTAERERIAAIMSLPGADAEKRRLAFETESTVDGARTALQGAPSAT